MNRQRIVLPMVLGLLATAGRRSLAIFIITGLLCTSTAIGADAEQASAFAQSGSTVAQAGSTVAQPGTVVAPQANASAAPVYSITTPPAGQNVGAPAAQSVPEAPRWDPYALPSERAAASAPAASPSSTVGAPATVPANPQGVVFGQSAHAIGTGSIVSSPNGVPSGASIAPGPAAGWGAAVPVASGAVANPAAVNNQIVNGVAQPPRTLPNMDNAQPLNPNSESATQSSPDNRPLYSVMVKHRTKPAIPETAAAAPTSVTPAIAEIPANAAATSESPVVTPTGYDSPAASSPRESVAPNVMTQAPPGTSFSPNSSGANNTYGSRGVAVGGPAGANGGSGFASAGGFRLPFSAPPATPRSEPPDPAKVAAARAAADLFAGAAAELQAQSEIVRVPLAEALAGTSEPQRLTVVGQYWRLSRAIKDYRWSQDELKRLEEIVPNRSPIDGPMLSTARAAAEARVHQAELAVVETREALIQTSAGGAMGNEKGDFVTADRPLLGPYNTYVATLFANRSVPGRVREIDRSLPIRLAAINDLTASVHAALSSINTAEEAHAKGETDIRTVLACHEALHNQRRAFLDAVLNYNLEIAEYATIVAAPGTPSDRFVAMLIYPRPTERIGSLPNHTEGPPSTSGAALDSNRQFGIRADGEQRPTSDGWTPSRLRSAEIQPPQSYREPANQAQPQNQLPSSDPFAAPQGGNRYGNYGDRSGNPVDRYGQPIR